jgi:hypothetical protein
MTNAIIESIVSRSTTKYYDQMSLYEAMCRITFKFNQSAIQALVLDHAKHREAA